MRSETPKDRADSSAFDHATASPEDREHRDSMAMDLLDTPGGDGSADGLGFDGGDGGTMLLPHERKLPIAEQRRIIAARKQHEDGVDEDDSQAMGGGKRGRGRRRMQQADQPHAHGHGGHRERRSHAPRQPGESAPLRTDGESDTGTGTAGGSALGPKDKEKDDGTTGTAGGTRIERDAPIDARQDTVRLDDPTHPHAPLYGAALKAVAELAPAQAAMGPTEQANVAAALTARMAGDAAFAQQLNDPSRLSFGLAQNGDRLFAINHAAPDAPNAVHVSVDLQQARAQSIEASSAHVDAAATIHDPAHGRDIETHTHEAHAREHAPRQA